jgi:hypothetical protein
MSNRMKVQVATACRRMANLGAELGTWAPTSEMTDGQARAFINLINSHADLLAQTREALKAKAERDASKRRRPARAGS